MQAATRPRTLPTSTRFPSVRSTILPIPIMAVSFLLPNKYRNSVPDRSTPSGNTLGLSPSIPLATMKPRTGTFWFPNILTANYNSIQMTLSRQQGPLRYGVNYTFSKALGLLGADGTGNPIDPTNLASNYSILAFDRTHVFNAHYSYDVGNPIKNRYLGLLGNGWEVSGITQFQSGQDLPIAQNNPNFGLAGTLGTSLPVGSTSRIAVTNVSLLGTPDVVLLPRFTCNPASGLVKGQYVNPKCYTLPNLGSNG